MQNSTKVKCLVQIFRIFLLKKYNFIGKHILAATRESLGVTIITVNYLCCYCYLKVHYLLPVTYTVYVYKPH